MTVTLGLLPLPLCRGKSSWQSYLDLKTADFLNWQSGENCFIDLPQYLRHAQAFQRGGSTWEVFPDNPSGLRKLHMTYTVVNTDVNIPPHTNWWELRTFTELISVSLWTLWTTFKRPLQWWKPILISFLEKQTAKHIKVPQWVQYFT